MTPKPCVRGTGSSSIAALFQALMALRALTWFPQSVRDIRAFRIEQ
jgi:virulence-associated protein VapD